MDVSRWRYRRRRRWNPESSYYDDEMSGKLYPSKKKTLHKVEPWVQYGLSEAQRTSVEHAMREVAAITYLIGIGYDPHAAHRIVESWEVNERF
nr:hypothetical protein [Risungbinella massiliensis]